MRASRGQQVGLQALIGCSLLWQHGTRGERRKPHLCRYPQVVVGHSGVDTGPELFGTAIAPADHSKQEEPVIFLAHQGPPRVSLQSRTVLEQNHGARLWQWVQTCCEYLARVLAPVMTASTKHVVCDQVSIIVLLPTQGVSKDVHPSLTQVLRWIPQTWREQKQTVCHGIQTQLNSSSTGLMFFCSLSVSLSDSRSLAGGFTDMIDVHSPP